MEKVLSGIRVVDFSWVGAGSLVTQTLAIHGADVIKIESSTHPDNLRVTGPYRPGHENIDGSGYFASRNANKRSMALNMKTEKGRDIARKLMMDCAVVSNNFRPGVMEKWQIGYQEISAFNPGVVYLAMPMNGNVGPHKNFIGFGSTIAAVCGLVDPSGLPGRAPIGTGTQYPDHAPNPGHALTILLAALYRRELTGKGCNIELAQLESTANVAGPGIIAASAGEVIERTGNRTTDSSPHGVFPCSGEDMWCAIAVRTDTEWKALVNVLGGALADADFATFAGRKANEDRLEKVISDLTKSWDRHELTARLQSDGVPSAAVATPADALSDPQLIARDFWKYLDHKEMGHYAASSMPFRWEGGAFQPERPAPLLGQHTWEIAESLLGMSRDEYDALVEEGVFS